MQESVAHFAEMPWAEVAPGVREQCVTRDGQVLRLVEFSPPFREADWCTKQHTGFVVAGQFSIEFSDSTVKYSRGDGIAIPFGDATAHRAIVDEPVVLFLVEPSELA